MKALAKKHWFILGLLCSVGLAVCLPEYGAAGGLLHSEQSTRWGIMVIFVLQGWILPLEAMLKGVMRWKLHLGIQLGIFLGFPLLCMVIALSFKAWMDPGLWTGLLFLSVLPTTISSAIVYTSLAGGSTAVALVNATIANILGIFICPLWMALLLKTGGVEMQPLLPVLLNIAKLILLPLMLGQFLRLWSHAMADRCKSRVGQVNSLIILFIVYASLSDSMVSGSWFGRGVGLILWALGLVVLLLMVSHILVLWVLGKTRLGKEERVAACFCCTQKTLAAGVPMAKSIFGVHPALGLILMPILLYHPLQLLVGSVLIHRFEKDG